MTTAQSSLASRGPILVFSTDRYTYLQREMCREMGLAPGVVERQRFPDGERYQRIRTDVTGRDVALVGGTVSDEDTLEMFDLANGLVRYGAHTLTLVIPYFGYSTMDRAEHAGEVVTAKARARLLSALPTAGSGNRVMLLDLHTEGLQHYFDGNLRPVHLHARTQVVEVARSIGGASFVLACADAGRAKWVESLANELGVVASFVFKRRITGRLTEVTAVSAQVEGRQVVIYDDMIRTGGTLLGAARAFLDAGATQVAAIATHGVFPGDSLERLHKSGIFSRIVVTDSHPRAVELRSPFLTVVSCAELLATALTRAD